MSKLDLILQSW